MKKGLFILLLLVLASSAGSVNEKLLPAHENFTRARRISSCVKEATRALFAPSNDVSIIVPNQTYYSDIAQDLIDQLIVKGIVKILTEFPNESKNEWNHRIRESSYVLIDNTVSLRKLLEDSNVSRWVEYIIVTEGKLQWFTEFADNLWNLGFQKVAFIRVESNGEMKLLRLIRDAASRSSPPTLVTYDLCNDKSVSSRSGNNRKSSKIIQPFSSLFNIPVNATLKFARLFEGSGSSEDFSRPKSKGQNTSLGIDIMDIFASKYNIELIRHTWENDQKSNWTEAMHRCVAGEMDFFYSHFPPSKTFGLGLVDAMNWYKFETLIFVDSLKLSLHPITGFLHHYGLQLWLCIFALLGIFGIFAYTIDTLNNRGMIRERITVLTIWAIFVVQPLSGFPAKFSLRFVLGLWLLHNLISSSLYTATFSTTLTTVDNRHRLRTFQDILDSGRPICAGAKTLELFNDTNDPQMLAIHNRLEVIVPKLAFSKIFNDGCVSSRHERYVREHNWKNRKNDSLRLYSVAEAVILNYPSYYYAKRHHPYRREFERIVSIVRNAGLMGFLNNLYSRKVGKTEDEIPLSTNNGVFLELKHLAVTFLILVIGYLIAGIVFLIELYTHKKSMNQHKPPNKKTLRATKKNWT